MWRIPIPICILHLLGGIKRITSKRSNITVGFIICWIGILIINGSHFGATKKESRKLWAKPSYGISIPYMSNTMPINAFEFLRRYIHFCNNSKRKTAKEAGYDILYKVRGSLDWIMKGIRNTWVAGKHLAINESMIKYMGRVIAYV